MSGRGIGLPSRLVTVGSGSTGGCNSNANHYHPCLKSPFGQPDMNPTPNSPALPAATPIPVAFPLPCIDSRSLLAGARELLIRHGNELYRLRHTKSDKLILVK